MQCIVVLFMKVAMTSSIPKRHFKLGSNLKFSPERTTSVPPIEGPRVGDSPINSISLSYIKESV